MAKKPKNRACSTCGRILLSRHGNTKYCSSACQPREPKKRPWNPALKNDPHYIEAHRKAGLKYMTKIRKTSKGRLDGAMRSHFNGRIRADKQGRKQSKGGQYIWTYWVGYTWDALKIHMEQHFQEGMSWANYGSVWEFDHIVPVSHFQYESPFDPSFKECWALANLRPFWVSENRQKPKGHLMAPPAIDISSLFGILPRKQAAA